MAALLDGPQLASRGVCPPPSSLVPAGLRSGARHGALRVHVLSRWSAAASANSAAHLRRFPVPRMWHIQPRRMSEQYDRKMPRDRRHRGDLPDATGGEGDALEHHGQTAGIVRRCLRALRRSSRVRSFRQTSTCAPSAPGWVLRRRQRQNFGAPGGRYESTGRTSMSNSLPSGSAMQRHRDQSFKHSDEREAGWLAPRWTVDSRRIRDPGCSRRSRCRSLNSARRIQCPLSISPA